MSRKYLKKETVAHRFKLEMLNKADPSILDTEMKSKLWVLYLEILYSEGKINKKAAETWKYPSNYIK